MATFCLPKQIAAKVKSAIVNGTLDPDKLVKMTSAQRRDFFAGIMGKENAKEVNLAFERKLLLKNQELAMVNWAREITGLSKAEKEATAAKIKATYAEKRRRKFSPEEDEAFLNELTSEIYSKKYRTDVTLEEAQRITELGKAVSDARAKLNLNEDGTYKNPEDQLTLGIEYGMNKVLLDEYVGGLKEGATKRELVNPLKADDVQDFVDAVKEDLGLTAKTTAEFYRAIQASWDNSFWGRQGFKAMTNPKYQKDWAKNFAKSFADAAKIAVAKPGKYIEKGNNILRLVKAEIYSRPGYLSGRYEMGTKLAVGIKEEEFPTSAPEKIPLLGRVFKASEVAYEAGAMRLRADVADTLYKNAEKAGIDLSDKFEVGSLNQLTNSLTGRGAIPAGEKYQKMLNVALFSVKNAKSNLDFLTAHQITGAGVSKFAKREAAKNLFYTVAHVGTVMGITEALWPDAVEWNPLSSDFGKIKIGNTRIDITGGMASYVTLLARVLSGGRTKSTSTGMIKKVGDQFGSDKMDILWDFVENKFSPGASLLKQLWEGEDWAGEPIGRIDAIIQAAIPIPVQSAYEVLKDPESAPFLLAVIADGLGFGTNTYGPKKTKGEEIFNQALELDGEEREAFIEQQKKLKETDPDLYKEIQEAEAAYRLEVSPAEKALKNLGVSNGERAMYIYNQTEGMETAEEKNAYIQSLIDKGLLDMGKTKDGKKTGSGWTVKSQVDEIKAAGSVKEWQKQNVQALPTDKYVDQRGVFGLVSDYTMAFIKDPENAWKALVGPERLGKVQGNLVELQRDYGLEYPQDTAQLIEDRKRLFAEAGIEWTDENREKYEIDHIVPVKAGGDNSDANKQVITKELHDFYTAVDVLLIDAVKDTAMTREEVEELELNFKVNQTITAEEVKEAIEDAYTEKDKLSMLLTGQKWVAKITEKEAQTAMAKYINNESTFAEIRKQYF